ncbi:trifunctional purine biosynthetic protein adenosine-3-related [Holotrichia oblita]|uniref:Trifunctional purine biosynthetic protein adenosine-3-related n=1 Tax=Holotrichia oblita TaxID=644536 RepID=A0ACB9SQV1_HOLOL|nr:trifunctional purine biosynthetic protein adenosine-3-related [Holotrichia oblita]
MAQNVLVIGGGGREHAIVWKLTQSNLIKTIYVAPGSYAIGCEKKAKNVDINIKDYDKLADWCQSNNVSLVIVGPEDPLANGIADVLTSNGIYVFGPQKSAARIEWDKEWAKSFMDRHKIPTARWKSFTNASEAKNFINSANFPALVVKATGLAAGKGVIVASNKVEACAAVDEVLLTKKFGSAGETIVVEELLEGEEISVLSFCDGNTIKLMLPAQDHKRIFDNDQGPNTGGMGAYCPCPLLGDDGLKIVRETILQRTIRGLQHENIRYTGVLYAGLMLTRNGPKVLEYNCRFGDPETQVILPLLESDLYSLMIACCTSSLDTTVLKWKHGVSAVGVVMASKGYPQTSSKGQVITGVDIVDKTPNSLVFHSGTALKDGNLVTNGGRVLITVSIATRLTTAAALAMKSTNEIKFEGSQYRKDIAHKGIACAVLKSGKLTYKASGVDITAGNDLVSHIKPLAKSTDRLGVLGGLGGFGGLFDLKQAGFKDPVLVSGTDGVGTKLKIAQEMGIHNTIGVDLVAMCVNDVLANGAEPLFFLDYFACGRLDINVAKDVINGVSDGCKQAGCSLIGGETAEMPDVYPPNEYDVAGFTVGAVERDHMLPQTSIIQSGDVVLALPSSGLHSNGFSMVRKVMDLANARYKDKAPFSFSGKSFGEELLEPTKIYVKGVRNAVKTGKVKAFAHITGGGVIENIPRVLPENLAVELDAKKWNIPEVFAWLAVVGGINESELLRTFNCGIGGVVIIAEEDEETILSLLQEYDAVRVGSVVLRNKDCPPVIVNNFMDVMETRMRKYVPEAVSLHATPKKKVGVLISGTGTNLQALIDATMNPTRHIGAEIVLVISNKLDVEGLKRAERANIPTKVLRHTNFSSREEFDEAMHDELVKAGVDIVCLAGFMRILSGAFTRKWKGRLINVHPALLPLFKGTQAQKQAIEAGVRVTGCSVHFVEEDVDAGAIITQETVPIHIGDTVEVLVERIKTAEHRCLSCSVTITSD